MTWSGEELQKLKSGTNCMASKLWFYVQHSSLRTNILDKLGSRICNDQN